MPKEGEPLTAEQVADLRRWIAEGAAWPKPRVSESLLRDSPGYAELRREHWAWQPLAVPTPPAVSDPSWPADDLDRFVLARLDAAGLQPVGDADLAKLRAAGLPVRNERGIDAEATALFNEVFAAWGNAPAPSSQG